MPLISLIHPSRGRAKQSIQNAKEWISQAGVDVQLVVSVDESDPQRSLYEELYQDYMGFRSLDKFLINPNTCVVEATNLAAKASDGDILLYLSDDFACFENWGGEILSRMELDKPMLIKVDDMYQKFHVDVLTMPIMNRALYNELGYFWHPAYRSMFVDQDLYHTVNNMGALRLCPELKFEHRHHCAGLAINDETYKRSSANWDSGKALYHERKSKGFPR